MLDQICVRGCHAAARQGFSFCRPCRETGGHGLRRVPRTSATVTGPVQQHLVMKMTSHWANGHRHAPSSCPQASCIRASSGRSNGRASHKSIIKTQVECSSSSDSSNSIATLAPRSDFETLAVAAGAEPRGLLTVGATPLGRGLVLQQVGCMTGH